MEQGLQQPPVVETFIELRAPSVSEYIAQFRRDHNATPSAEAQKKYAESVATVQNQLSLTWLPVSTNESSKTKPVKANVDLFS